MATTEPATSTHGSEQTPPTPYTIFGPVEKRLIMIVASLGGCFASLSANICYPALNTMAVDFAVSATEINLALTVYMLFQAIAPAFIAGLSDTAGRRPSFLICFIIIVVANVSLASLGRDFVALVVLRCFQSIGSSPITALMNAVIADISPPAERGSYMGFVFAGSLLGQPTGLILGGVLSHFYGWRAVFWLLFVLAGLFFVPYIGFMPETCRKIVGNGSVRPATWWNLPVVDMLQHRRVTAGTFDEATGSFAGGKASGATSPFSTLKALNPLTTVIILAERSAGGIILCTGLLYAGLAAVTVGLPFYFKESHDLNDLEIGLAFMPIGFGSCVAAISTGALADWNYKRHAHRLGLPTHQGAQQDMSVFPIEAARLQIAFPLVIVGIVAMIIYGWVLQVRAPIALPLAVNCVLAFIVTGAFSIMSTLLIDLNADRPATATAANNLFRSLLGAGVTMALLPMWDVFGIGWTFMIFTATWVLVAAVMLLLMRRGLMWRRTQQEAKMEPSEAQALAKDVELEDLVDGESDDGKV